MEPPGSGAPTGNGRDAGCGNGTRKGRMAWGGDEGGGEGETTVIWGGVSIEGTGTGEARSEPGMMAGVAPAFIRRRCGEVCGVVLCSVVSLV